MSSPPPDSAASRGADERGEQPESADAHAAAHVVARAAAAEAARATARADQAVDAAAAAQRTADAAQRDVPVGVIMVGISAVIWWPAFVLGAWGELFFDDVLGLWAASIAAFVYVLIEHQSGWRRLRRAAFLLLPTVWLVVKLLVDQESESDLVATVVNVLAVLAVAIGMPFTLFVLARIVWPEFGTRSGPSRRIILAVAGGIIAASYLLGVNQAAFLTCEDFDISGNSRPPGCVEREAPAP